MKLDTVQSFYGKTLIHYKIYQDSLLIEDGQAFFYPWQTNFKVPRFRLFPYLFKASIDLDSVTLHGTVKRFKNDQKFQIGEYKNGVKSTIIYYDSEGKNISRQEYYGGLRTQTDPEIGTWFYSRGKRKKKQNDFR